MDANKQHEKSPIFDNIMNRNQILDALKAIDNTKSKLTSQSKQTLQDTAFGSLNDKTNRYLKHEFSRSFSLNDLISAANELISQQAENDLIMSKDYLPKSHQNLNKLKDYLENNNEDNMFFQNRIKKDQANSKDHMNKSENKLNQHQSNNKETEKIDLAKTKFLSSSSKQLLQPSSTITTSTTYQQPPIIKKNFALPHHINQHTPKSNIQSILKNSSNQLSSKTNGSGHNLVIESNKIEEYKTKITNDTFVKLSEQYKLKQSPKQRLEIDILPSHLSCCKNKLLIASSFGKIRGKFDFN